MVSLVYVCMFENLVMYIRQFVMYMQYLVMYV